jgi:integrase
VLTREMAMSERLTEKSAGALPIPDKGNRIYWDAPNAKGKDHTPGFGLRITAGGARAFILNYRTRSGRERRITIGSLPAWSLMAAREEAAALKRRIDQGEDPLADRQETRDAPTMGELCDRFVTEHMAKKRPSTQRSYQAAVDEIRKALGTRKVAEVTVDDVERLHRKITERGAGYVANRTAAVMSRMCNMAVRSGWRSDNPVRGLERNEEQKRQRYLKPDELARLVGELANHPDRQAANIIHLLLLTGARSGEILSARWEDIDVEHGRWTKPSSHTKTKREHRLDLSDEAVKLLRSINKAAGHPERGYAFPGRVGGQHRVNLKDAWTVLCKAAKITGARIHDLRHTHAALLASAGFSLPIIGAALGHTQAATTARYAHVHNDPLRVAANHVGSILAGKRPGKVVAFKGGRR